MPGSKISKFALHISIHVCGIIVSFADHDEYLQRLDAFATSPDPKIENGILSNEVFAIDVNGSFEFSTHSSTFFKYYSIIELLRYPNGIFGDEIDHLLISTQEVLLSDNLQHIVNDDLYNFTDDDMNLTGELLISEFTSTHGYDVLFWEAKQVSSSSTLRSIYKFHLQGPKVLQSTSFAMDPYQTWLHVSFLFESDNGTMTIDEARKIVNSLQFTESTNIPFEPTEKGAVAVSFPINSKVPQWYTSKWFGAYYDSTEGWIFHEFLGWIYTLGSTGNGVWFWHVNIGWFWTVEETYPYIYSDLKNNWLFLDIQSEGEQKRYYDFSIQSWQLLSEPNIDVQLNDQQQSSFTSNPRDQKKQAVSIIANSNIPEEEAKSRISQIILFGL